MIIKLIDQIEITANRSEDEPWRLKRLRHVLGYIYAFCNLFDKDYFEYIKSLHDHKGQLTVVFKKEPPIELPGIIVNAWNSPFGDNSTNVVFEVLEQQ